MTLKVCYMAGELSVLRKEHFKMKLGPNKKKIPVFRVTRPYLNLLVKPRIFFSFSGKNV